MEEELSADLRSLIIAFRAASRIALNRLPIRVLLDGWANAERCGALSVQRIVVGGVVGDSVGAIIIRAACDLSKARTKSSINQTSSG